MNKPDAVEMVRMFFDLFQDDADFEFPVQWVPIVVGKINEPGNVIKSAIEVHGASKNMRAEDVDWPKIRAMTNAVNKAGESA